MRTVNLFSPFHYSFLVTDIYEALAFYSQILGCNVGRSTNTWIDFDFFGHQISCHISEKVDPPQLLGLVDGKVVPIPHFGPLVSPMEFEKLEERLLEAKWDFIVPPYTRFSGLESEQKTMLFLDPFGNAIEIKSFKNGVKSVFSQGT